MISRLFNYPKNHSFFLLGPRGTGKSFFLQQIFPQALYINLLSDDIYQKLVARPSRLKDFMGTKKWDWVIIDEIQKIPALLDEVHLLIEEKKQKFILTGSSARKLKRSGANLLAGRAYTSHSYPFTSLELGKAFDLNTSLKYGMLPKAQLEGEKKQYLASYVQTYLKEEVQQEGLVRNLGTFARFLEAASFSQGQVINYSNVASECSIERKTVTNYFELLEDLLLSRTLEVFALRAKRELIKQKKFYFFDTGVFRQIRPTGPLDSDSEINGASLETLVMQELMARNEYLNANYKINYWHTRNHLEVDFILYGEKGFKAIEVKSSSRIREKDCIGLLEFKKDYPKSELFFIYGGSEEKYHNDIKFIPAETFFKEKDLGIGF